MPGKLLIFTGAGISAESGISTFRGASGLWEGHNVDKVCNYFNWQSNYDEVHAFYNARRTALANVEPNAAHYAVKEWQDRYDTTIITQNIDDLFERAGCTDVLHVHGNLTRMRCIACGHEWDIGYSEWHAGKDECISPKCPCRGAIKPDVVFFNEVAPMYRKMHKALDQLGKDDVAVVIGTSFQVINIAAMLSSKFCLRILNNLAPNGSMMDGEPFEKTVFEHIFFEPATLAVEKIDTLLREKLG